MSLIFIAFKSCGNHIPSSALEIKEIVSVNTSNNTTNASSTTYVLDPNGNQLFITLTPDEASLITSEISSDLGRAGQQILLSNTFFDPVMIEVEMVDQNIKTLSYALYG